MPHLGYCARCNAGLVIHNSGGCELCGEAEAELRRADVVTSWQARRGGTFFATDSAEYNS